MPTPLRNRLAVAIPLLWVCALPAALGAEAGQDAELMRLWSRTCALCHVDGSGGAPRLGHPEEWRARVARGAESLLTHTVEGFGNMPPLGYCMACERDDFAALIELMSGAMPPPAGQAGEESAP